MATALAQTATAHSRFWFPTPNNRPFEREVSLPLFDLGETYLAHRLVLREDSFYTYAQMREWRGWDGDTFTVVNNHLFLMVVRPKEGVIEGTLNSGTAAVVRGAYVPSGELMGLHSRMWKGTESLRKKEFKSAALDLLRVAESRFKELGANINDPNVPATVMGEDAGRMAKDLERGSLHRVLIRTEK